MWKCFTILSCLALASCDGCDGGQGQAPVAAASAPGLRLVDSCPMPTVPGDGTFEFAPDVAYHEVGGERLAMDVAWPNTPGPKPLVVMIHGGGWSVGHRHQVADEVKMMVARGYAAATVSYRLAGPGPKHPFPAAAQDVRCAVRFLLARAADYNIDPKRVALLGLSAGGHLAALTGATGSDPRLDGPCPSGKAPIKVRGVVALYPPLDLRASVFEQWTDEVKGIVTNFLGAPPAKVPAAAALASPMTHVKAGLPPFLLVHSKLDTMVPISHSRRFKAALDRAGVPVLLVEVTGVGHGHPPFHGAPTLRQATCTTLAFLDAVLKK